VRPTARVEARRLGGPWQRCDYLRVTATYDCEGLVTAYDATANLLNDAPPSWGFVAPAILATAYVSDVDIRIWMHARLAGTYDAAVNDGVVTLTAGSDAPRMIERETVGFLDRGEQLIELQAHVPPAVWSFSLVRDDALVPERPFLAWPPDQPAPEVQAIAAAATAGQRK
jgi:hypothetical protein